MELHAFAERKNGCFSIVLHFFGFHQERNGTVLGIESIEPLENMLGDHGGQVGSHHVLVEGGRFVDDGDTEDPALFRSECRSGGDDKETQAPQQDSSHPIHINHSFSDLSIELRPKYFQHPFCPYHPLPRCRKKLNAPEE